MLPLWKRIFKPELDDIAFIGFAQPLPTLFPFCEFQSKLVARWLAGEWAPPTTEKMREGIRYDESRFVGHYGKRQRHTMQVDYYVYEYEMNRKIIPSGLRRAASGTAVQLAGRAAPIDSTRVA